MDGTSIGEIKLVFSGKNGGLKFSSEEEFFETLGKLCREDRPVKIRSKKSQTDSEKFKIIDKNGNLVTIV